MFKIVFIGCILFLSWCVNAEDDEECTIKSENAVGSLGEMIKKAEPFTFTNLKPTIWVKASGISGLTLTPDKEVQTTRNAGETKSQFWVYFPLISIDALVELPENPAKIPSIVQESMTEATSKNCPADQQDAAQKGISSAGVPTMSLTDMLGLKECQPALPSVPSGGAGGGVSVGGGGISGGIGRKKRASASKGQCGNGKVSGMMYIRWKNVKVTFGTKLAAGAKAIRITSVDILSKDYNKIDVKCQGDCKGFPQACKCLVATKFPVILVVNAVNIILPCTVDGEAQKHANLIQYFNCDA